MILLNVQNVGIGIHVFEAIRIEFKKLLEPFKTGVELLVVVERVGNLVHDKIRILEKTQNTVIELDADVVSVLLHAE